MSETQIATIHRKVATLNIEEVAIADIYIDSDYQRDEVKPHIAHMADNFTLDQFGVPMLGRRSSGRLYCVNGRQRIRAAEKAGYTHIHAHVFASNGQKHEASMFTAANRNSRKISGVPWHKANVVAQDPAALWIERILGEYGLTALPTGPAGLRVVATGVLYAMFDKMGEDEATRCLRWTLDVFASLWVKEYPARDWTRLNLVAGAAWSAHHFTTVPAVKVHQLLDVAQVKPGVLSDVVTNVGNGSAVSRYADNFQRFVNGLSTEEVFQ